MKKLLVAALAICLVVAFALPAVATDVKFSGQYYVRGIAWNSQDVRKDKETTQQNYFSKFRLNADFAIEEGVGAHVRGDIFDNFVWGSDVAVHTMDFDHCYAWMDTSLGKFTLGQQDGGQWGTTFGDEWRRAAKITYEKSFGPWSVMASIEKGVEADNGTTSADGDTDYYYLGGGYKWDGGVAAILASYTRSASQLTSTYKAKTYGLTPYMKATFGPVYVEAELTKLFGNEKEYEDGLTTPDVSRTGLAGYAMAKMNFGPAYVGGFFAYVQGDDPTTTNENELGATGDDWDLGYILFCDEDFTKGSGVNDITTYGAAAAIGKEFGLTNNDGAIGYGLIAGVSPTEKLSIKAALVTANADEREAGYVDDNFGIEFDAEATYKIFSSVSYTVRFGYLWTGDYWKGTNAANEVEDIWMAEHVISWTF